MFATIRVLSGDRPGPPLEDLVRRVDAPTLLISAGTDVERAFNLRYDPGCRRARRALESPGCGPHARDPQPPAEYERRVVGLFDDALR